MDYDSLFQILPKEPKRWSINDISLWLDFIGLGNLKEIFQMNSIDGSCLGLIEEKELEEDLQIRQKLMRKKLMNWLTTGLQEYTFYLKSKPNQTNSDFQMEIEHTQQFNQIEQSNNNNLTNNLDVTEIPKQKQNPDNTLINELLTNYYKQDQQHNYNEYLDNLQQGLDNNQTNYELIIKPTEGNQSSFYSIKDTGGKIGRHSSNQILILEESISRFHAEIVYERQDFYLQDIGSTTGTFVKIDQKMLLLPNMMIELGSNQFLIESISSQENEHSITLQIFEGPNVNDKHTLKFSAHSKSVQSIGRKPIADLSFPDDHHMSNIHAKIFLIDGQLSIEDMGSTNGSWIRLSKEANKSQPYLLKDQMTFKIGTTSTYQCYRQNGVKQEKVYNDCCIICCENERDALYMPCKHNAACLKCSKNLRDCPLCRVKIEDFIRIYKN